jgi:hypothetical protein
LAQAKESEAETVQRQSEFQGNGELVQLVDDDVAVRNSVAMLLERLNFRVLASTSGHDALVSFAQRREEIQVVICDLQMPHMDGAVLVQAIRRMSPLTRIIVMSGNPGERQLADLKSAGVAAILIKPFAANQLVDSLKSLFAEKTTAGKAI